MTLSASLPSVRDAFEALFSQKDATAAAAEQTPDVLRRRIAGLQESWRRLNEGMNQWANLLAMARDTLRDIAVAAQPLAAAAFATLDPLLQSDIPEPDWESALQAPTPQIFLDMRRDAVEHLERRLALLTQFSMSCQGLCLQAGCVVPEELLALLSPPFRAQQLAAQPTGGLPAQPQIQPSSTASGMQFAPQIRQTGFAPAGKAAEVVGTIQEQFTGKSDQASMAALRQAQSLKTLLERWSSPEEWSSLTEEERNRRSALMQSLWDRAQHLASDA